MEREGGDVLTTPHPIVVFLLAAESGVFEGHMREFPVLISAIQMNE